MTSYSPAILRATSNEMLEKLLTLDDAKELLVPTEGLAEYEFYTDGTDSINFDFPSDWNMGLEDKSDFDLTDAVVSIKGTDLPLTKSGALELASEMGFSKSAVSETPGSIVSDYLNYHYTHGGRGKKRLKVLASNTGALAVVRGTMTPFSGSSLLDAVVEGIGARYSTDDLRIDYKWNHNLQATNMRIIIPSATRNIGSARAEKAGDDPWSLGIEVVNSIEGKHSLELKGYLFAWWCTNGCTTTHASSGRYRRRPTMEINDAYEWARSITDDVFNDLDNELNAIEHLTQVPLEGELTQTVGNLFERFEVPDNTREAVMNNLVESDDLSAYGLLNAITSAGNNPELTPNAVSALLTAGGEIAHVMSERCDYCHKF